jgi:putative ABC transport system permease protein
MGSNLNTGSLAVSRRPWLFTRLAVQSLGRRPARTALLAASVAVCVGSLLAAITLGRAIENSMGIGFSRMGADLVVVPSDTMVNLTPALLTVEPSPHLMAATEADNVAQLAAVECVAPQRYWKIPVAEQGHLHDIDVVAFDPHRDFTVLPWLKEHLNRPVQEGDVLVGGRREEIIGGPLTLGGRRLTVYGRLGLTGVGPFDRACFVTFATAASLTAYDPASQPDQGMDKISAVLVRLSIGSRPDHVRFALADRPELKIVPGNPLFTSVRQTLTSVLRGVTAFALIMLAGIGLMVGSLYSAVLTERRRELGLLLALGMRGAHLVRLIVAEAALTTGLGGLAGVLLGAVLLLFVRRSLVYNFEWLEVPFLWPTASEMTQVSLVCLVLAAGVGLLGAVLPAWRASRQDPFELVRAGDH